MLLPLYLLVSQRKVSASDNHLKVFKNHALSGEAWLGQELWLLFRFFTSDDAFHLTDLDQV